MTQHDLESASNDPTSSPRRRDIHHPDRTRRTARVDTTDATDSTDTTDGTERRPRTRGRRAVRVGVPAALTVMALTTGVVTGVTSASGEPRTDTAAPASGTAGVIGSADAFGTTDSGGVFDTTTAATMASSTLPGAASATAGVVDASAEPTRTAAASSDADATAVPAADEAVTAAQSALTRADHVTTEQTAPAKQRKAVAESAEHLQAVVERSATDAAASRTDERVALSARTDDDEAASIAEATDDLTQLLDADAADAVDAEPAPADPVAVEPAPAAPADVLSAQAAQARKAAPELAKLADDTAGYENGRLSSGDLRELAFASGETLRRDAADQLERLDAAYQARFGEHLQIRDSYRSYDDQVAVKASHGYMAAVPGYSNHGWGVAVDINGGVEEFGSTQYEWLRENAPKFGWDNPDWAEADGRKPEAWHWEYSPL